MSLFQVELNSGFVAALLTVLGYSNHDSVVIFDRIRENMRVRRRPTFAETVNHSLLETLARSVNIVFTVLLTVVALLIFGGPAIRGFSLALLFGTATGCYSSIFTAAPIVVLLEGRAARAKAAQLATARGRGGLTRPSRSAAPTREAATSEVSAEGAGSGRAVIERLQAEEMEARQQEVEADSDAKREDRRDRRKREKEREGRSKGGKPKRRF
jgi:hypothetical protein